MNLGERGEVWSFGASNESYISTSITFNDAILKITKERRAGSVNSFWYFSKYIGGAWTKHGVPDEFVLK